MIKKIEVTLLVEVDTEDEFICPSGDPLLENCVVNTVEDGFFTDPVKILEGRLSCLKTKHICYLLMMMNAFYLY